jgi:hypothetical protein
MDRGLRKILRKGGGVRDIVLSKAVEIERGGTVVERLIAALEESFQ